MTLRPERPAAEGPAEPFDRDPALAPPMQNGEVAFEAPWQGRAFGMARAMAAAGVFDWDEFRAHLIAELGGWQPEQPFEYYGHFLRALERLLEEKGLVSTAALAERVDAFARRPHGHDHGHHGQPQEERR